MNSVLSPHPPPSSLYSHFSPLDPIALNQLVSSAFAVLEQVISHLSVIYPHLVDFLFLFLFLSLFTCRFSHHLLPCEKSLALIDPRVMVTVICYLPCLTQKL